MYSGGWEIVGKNKKDKNVGKAGKLTKLEKKKFIENAPKVEDFCELKAFICISLMVKMREILNYISIFHFLLHLNIFYVISWWICITTIQIISSYNNQRFFYSFINYCY